MENVTQVATFIFYNFMFLYILSFANCHSSTFSLRRKTRSSEHRAFLSPHSDFHLLSMCSALLSLPGCIASLNLSQIYARRRDGEEDVDRLGWASAHLM